MLRNNKNLRGNMLSNNIPVEEQEMYQPTIYQGLENKRYTMFFNEQIFEPLTIESTISTLLDVEVSGSYVGVDIYLKSVGGDADALIMLADMMNKYSLDIKFIVHGEIASCGALLPLMVFNSEIEFLPTARAMFHIAWTRVGSSTQYDYVPNMDMESSNLEGILSLNKYLLENFYSKLPLTSEEFDTLKQGKDIYIKRDRMETIYDGYKNNVYFDKYFDDDMMNVEEEINELEKKILSLKKYRDEKFKDYETYSQIDNTAKLARKKNTIK